jgi:hypothetical protein
MLRNLSVKRKNTLIIVFIIVIAAVSVFIIYNLTNMPKTSIADNAIPLSVASGDKVVVTVEAASLEDMYGYQFQVNYDRELFDFSGGLESDIGEIETIFSKPFDGYELVGATMIGEKQGVSGEGKSVCTMTLTARADGVVSADALSLSDVRVIRSDLSYEEDAGGWNCGIALQG